MGLDRQSELRLHGTGINNVNVELGVSSFDEKLTQLFSRIIPRRAGYGVLGSNYRNRIVPGIWIWTIDNFRLLEGPRTEV
jgi:hypothetical protein